MKKYIAKQVLSLAVAVTLLFGLCVTADASGTNLSGATIRYEFYQGGENGQNTGWDFTIFDYTATRHWGFAGSNSNASNLSCLPGNIQAKSLLGEFIAFKVKVFTPGRYYASLEHLAAVSGGIAGVYVADYTDGMEVSDIQNLAGDSANRKGEVDFFSADVATKKSAIGAMDFDFDPAQSYQEYVIIFKAETKSTGANAYYMYPKALVLDGRSIKTATIEFSQSTIESGRTAVAEPIITLNDDSTTTDAEITYSSDRPGVASVNSITGEITGISPGTASIKARIERNGEIKTASSLITVVSPTGMSGQKVDLIFNKTGENTADDFTSYRYSETRRWEYFDSGVTHLVGGSRVSCIALCAQARTGLNGYIAIKVDVPAGRYSLDFDYQAVNLSSKIGLYITPYIEGNNVAAHLAGLSPHATVDAYDTSAALLPKNSKLPDIVLEDMEYLFVFRSDGVSEQNPTQTDHRMYITKLTLDGTGLDRIDLNLPATVAVGQSDSLSVTGILGSGGSTAISPADTEYTSSSPAIAEVINGTVTGITPGTADITAKVTIDDRIFYSTRTLTVNEAVQAAPDTGTLTINVENVANPDEAINEIEGYNTWGEPQNMTLGAAVLPSVNPVVTDRKFAYWKNPVSNRIVSLSATFEAPVKIGTNTVLTAVYMPLDNASDEKVLVDFIDKNGKILQSSIIDKGTTVSPPENAFSPGYITNAWNAVYSGEIINRNSFFIAESTRSDETYTITVLNGTGGGSGYRYNDMATVSTDIDDDEFSYWARRGADGKDYPVSFDKTYSFYVWDNSILTACTKSVADVIDIVPTVSASPKIAQDGSGKYRFMVWAERILPEGCEMLEFGIVFSTTQANNEPTIENCDSAAVSQNNTDRSAGQFTARIDSLNQGSYVYARAYLIYKQEGSYRVLYSSTVGGEITLS
jgi:hypothetical protein